MTSFKFPSEFLAVCRALKGAGYQAWLVGGAVRDLGADVHDWDLATDATPERVMGLFPRVIPTGLQHGTVTVLQGRQQYEVTTFRAESGYQDGRHPGEVQFLKDIRQDLARRDFTINAMALDPLTMKVCDPYGGSQDLQAKILRAVGSPEERFAEDGLRVLRGCRFVSQLGFQVDPATKQAMGCQEALLALSRVAPERVQQELLKLLAGRAPQDGLALMQEVGALQVCLPELVPMVGCQQNRYHGYDVWGHTLATVQHCGPQEQDLLGVTAVDPLLRMAALLHDIAKPATRAWNQDKQDWTFYDHDLVGAKMASSLLSRLRFSTADKSRIAHLVRHHFIRYQPDWSDTAVRRWVRRVGQDSVQDLLVHARADILGKGPALVELELGVMLELHDRLQDLQAKGAMAPSAKDLAVNGHDLIQLGWKAGPELGAILKQLLDHCTEHPEDNTKEVLLGITKAQCPV